MPFRAAVVRCTIAGSIYGGAEQWSTGFWLGHEETDAEDPTQAAADAIRALWDTFYTSATAPFSSLFATTEVRLTWFSAPGNIDEGKTQFAVIQNPATGSASTTKFPPQIALVASLRSDRARGRGSHGRMFLPGPAMILGTNGKISTSDRDLVADRLKTFFDGIRASASIPWDPILVSPEKATVPITAGINETITHVMVGDVYDTQRRRRNQLVESYANRVLA